MTNNFLILVHAMRMLIAMFGLMLIVAIIEGLKELPRKWREHKAFKEHKAKLRSAAKANEQTIRQYWG